MRNLKMFIVLGMVAASFAQAASSGVESNAQALQLYRTAHYAEAEAMYRRALDAFDRSGEGAGLERSLTLANIAVMLRLQARYPESEKLHREALSRIEELTGPDSPETIRAVSNLAVLCWSTGQLQEAESLAVRAETAYRAEAAPNPADRSANRQILALIYLTQHRHAEGEKLLRNVLENGTSPVTAYSNLAAATLNIDDYPRAEEYARRAVEAAQSGLSARHPFTAAALNNLAQACRFQGKYLEAENAYRQAIEIWQDTLGPRHPDLARSLMNLAAFYHERGRESGAEELYGQAAAIFGQSLGKHHAEELVVRSELADVLRAQRRYTESEKLHRATLSAMQTAFRENDPRLVRAQVNYGRLQAETHPAAPPKDVKVLSLR